MKTNEQRNGSIGSRQTIRRYLGRAHCAHFQIKWEIFCSVSDILLLCVHCANCCAYTHISAPHVLLHRLIHTTHDTKPFTWTNRRCRRRRTRIESGTVLTGHATARQDNIVVLVIYCAFSTFFCFISRRCHHYSVKWRMLSFDVFAQLATAPVTTKTTTKTNNKTPKKQMKKKESEGKPAE